MANMAQHLLDTAMKEGGRPALADKYPRLVWLTDSLPKGPTGKILRREVQAPPDVGAGGAR